MLRRSLLLLCCLIPVASVDAQAKRPLRHSDADGWRSITSSALSRDGKYAAYALVPQDGEGEYIVRNLRSGQEQRIPTGGLSAGGVTVPSSRPAGTRGVVGVGVRLAFTSDNRLLVLSHTPTKADIAKAVKDKKDPPRAGILLLELATGQTTRIEGARNWILPESDSTFLAYMREAKPAAPPKDPKKPDEPMKTQVPVKPAPPPRTYGGELVLRNLADKSERSFNDVVEFQFTKDAKALLYTVSSKTDETNGVYLAVPGISAAPVAILSGKGRYQRLIWDENQTQLAFFAEQGETSGTPPRWKVYQWERKSAAVSYVPPAHGAPFVALTTLQGPMLSASKAVEVLSATTPGFRNGWLISDRGSLAFTRDGSRLLVSAAPAPPETPAKPETPQERVDLDLWHWQDDYIQPMQKLRADSERNRVFQGILHLKDKKYVQLAEPDFPSVSVLRDGTVALGADDKPYRRLVGSATFSGFFDYYLIDTREGTRKLLRKKEQGGFNFSPGGKYALDFDGKTWTAIDLATGKSADLTGKLGVAFHDEDHDLPSPPRPFGIVGWTANDASVLLYDRHDLWQINPDGTGAKNLTQGVGRKNDIRFRHVVLDATQRTIDPTKPLLLSAENLHTRDQGFYRLDVKVGTPKCLIMASRAFSAPVKAKDADVYLLTAQTFSEYPDLIVADADFKEMKKISDANPQKKDFVWGNAELLHYKSDDGKALQAILIRPENYEPGKKYPMVVYIYERLSNNMHRFIQPRPGTTINASHYASNGYLVLMPDISYTVGNPGPSAIKCVLPAVSAVANLGILDEKAIGIQGHSWGGYQIAYMITQTNRFKAAVAGAPVANMISAYNGVRWGSGLPRQFQYEQAQSRIGGTPWDVPLRYLDNSPIFRADRVQTPLMMLHNDQDDAVPWYQGIEYYLALRRLDKEVYLLNYNGERHGLSKRANMKDYSARMQEFFDHHLKGSPKPIWMEKGVSYLERMKNSPVSPPPFGQPGTTSGEEEEP